MDTAPNGWAVLIALIGTLGPIAATIVTYLLTRRGQDPKLDQIHESAVRTEVQVNGKSDKQDQLIAELQAHIEDLTRKP